MTKQDIYDKVLYITMPSSPEKRVSITVTGVEPERLAKALAAANILKYEMAVLTQPEDSVETKEDRLGYATYQVLRDFAQSRPEHDEGRTLSFLWNTLARQTNMAGAWRGRSEPGMYVVQMGETEIRMELFKKELGTLDDPLTSWKSRHEGRGLAQGYHLNLDTLDYLIESHALRGMRGITSEVIDLATDFLDSRRQSSGTAES